MKLVWLFLYFLFFQACALSPQQKEQRETKAYFGRDLSDVTEKILVQLRIMLFERANEWPKALSKLFPLLFRKAVSCVCEEFNVCIGKENIQDDLLANNEQWAHKSHRVQLNYSAINQKLQSLDEWLIGLEYKAIHNFLWNDIEFLDVTNYIESNGFPKMYEGLNNFYARKCMPYYVNSTGSYHKEVEDHCQQEVTDVNQGIPKDLTSIIEIIIGIILDIISKISEKIIDFLTPRLLPCFLVEVLLDPELMYILEPTHFFGVATSIYEIAVQYPSFQFFFAKIQEVQKHDLFSKLMTMNEVKNVFEVINDVVDEILGYISPVIPVFFPADVDDIVCVFELILWLRTGPTSFCQYTPHIPPPATLASTQAFMQDERMSALIFLL